MANRRRGERSAACTAALLAAGAVLIGETRAGEAARPIAASYAPVAAVRPADRLDPAAALDRINAFRAQNGLGPLVLDAALSRAATDYAGELSRRRLLSHIGADGGTPFDRALAAGYDALTLGENLAAGQRTLDAVIEGWTRSPDHRRTLLMAEGVHVGLGLVYDPQSEYRTVWTMLVAEPF